MYVSGQQPDVSEGQQTDGLIEPKGTYQETLLTLGTITNEIELITKFVADYWNTTDKEKQLALGKLTRIVNRLKKIRFPDFTAIER